MGSGRPCRGADADLRHIARCPRLARCQSCADRRAAVLAAAARHRSDVRRRAAGGRRHADPARHRQSDGEPRSARREFWWRPRHRHHPVRRTQSDTWDPVCGLPRRRYDDACAAIVAGRPRLVRAGPAAADRCRDQRAVRGYRQRDAG